MNRTNTGKGDPRWESRSYIASFIKTLHLLDLDLLPDWPSISEATFSARPSSSQGQNRPKAVEWSLYRLFQLYQPAECQTKLTSNFPATTPLRSKALRAALYKWLADLKASGVLGKEIVLRKTMLDDCKGDKFEELLCVFAILVLRSVADKDHGELLERVARTDDAHAVPLAIAYRVSLQRNLETRKALREDAARFADEVAAFREELGQRAEAAARRLDPIAPNDLAGLEDEVNGAFAANREWAAFLLRGNPASAMSRPVPRPFAADREVDGARSADPSRDLVQEMQQMLLRQKARRERLEKARDTLLKQAPPPSEKARDGSVPQPARSTARFTRHKSLNLDNLAAITAKDAD